MKFLRALVFLGMVAGLALGAPAQGIQFTNITRESNGQVLVKFHAPAGT